jgi:HSP20 family protein
VTFHDGELTITGERKADAPEKQEVRSYQERSFGRFERRLTIHSPINADQVKATHRDGILTVTLPKVEEVRPRQIEIATA